MKRILSISIIILFCSTAYSQKYELGVNGIAGYTAINLESVIGESLTDYDQFSYGGNLYGLYHLNDNILIGAEFGYHRLYYWEYAFSGFGYGRQYRWGDVSTIQFGPILECRMNNFYGQTGLNLRSFNDDSGSSAALMFGVGYKINLSKNIAIPLGIRTDEIFGSGTPIAIDLTVGVRFTKK